ncbi:MAG: AAA family ATPase [Chloroflexota bacterium]|nr:AAA family ATPase [Chloroflexota bacterium]
MKVAVAGKGGSGKTTIAGTLARVFAQGEHRVLAIDADPNPNLAVSLGVDAETAARIEPVPFTYAHHSEDAEGNYSVGLDVTPEEIAERYGTPAPDGVNLLLVGRVEPHQAGVGCNCAAHATVRGILEHLHQGDDYLVVTDMEAGLEHLKRGTLQHAGVLLIVVEPYFKSLEAAGRIAELGRNLGVPALYAVANKVQSARDEDAIRDYCGSRGLPVLAVIPFDPDVSEAERHGRAVLDDAPDATAVQAVRGLARDLRAADDPARRDQAAD